MLSNASKILLSPLFLISLFLLLLNDFVLKSQFHNFLTGKISDFAGLFIFSLFFISFLPKRKLIVLLSIATLFTFWKSPFSESFINYWNSFEILTVWRVVDYTDLFALSVLPFAYFYSNYCFGKYEIKLPFKQVATSSMILVSLFAFIATSRADEHGFRIKKEYTLNLTKSRFEEFLKHYEKIEYISVSNMNAMPNVKYNPNEYFAHFRLKRKICDTNTPAVSFIFIEQKDKITIKFPSVDVHCASFADRNTNTAVQYYEPIIKSIFELEVIDKLKEYSQQNNN